MKAFSAKTGAAIILVVVTLFVAGSFPHCVGVTVAGKGEQSMQMQRFRQIGIATRAYAGDHEGRFPASLDSILEEIEEGGAFLKFKAIGGEESARIWYARGLTDRSPAERIVLAHPFPHKRGKSRLVMFADGTCESIKEAEFQRLGREQKPDFEIR